MIEEIKDWIGVSVVGLTGVFAFFKLKGDVRVMEENNRHLHSRICDLENIEPQVIDLSQVAKNTLAIQRLELAYERADEQRKNTIRLLEKTQEAVEKQNDKQDKFQQEILQGITKLSTELQERTKALHS